MVWGGDEDCVKCINGLVNGCQVSITTPSNLSEIYKWYYVLFNEYLKYYIVDINRNLL